MTEINREIRLASRPDGLPNASNFELAETPVPEPGPGQVLVRNVYMSVDPSMRGRMNDVRSYVPPFEVGRPLEGRAVGRVVRSNDERFGPGDAVGGSLGWREFHVAEARSLTKLDVSEAPLAAHLGVLGGTGFTAYVGMLDIGQAKAGDTVFVSGAAGAVGTVAGQIGKALGCRVVGSAGSAEKVRFLEDEVGFDAAWNYRERETEDALRECAPDGVDVYFDNVGGEQLRAALNQMRTFGRIVACGMISQYNAATPPAGPDNLINIVTRRLTMRGFIIIDHVDRRAGFMRDVSSWLRDGTLRDYQTVVEGIENAPRAFLGMLQGENTGKMLVRLGPEA